MNVKQNKPEEKEEDQVLKRQLDMEKEQRAKLEIELEEVKKECSSLKKNRAQAQMRCKKLKKKAKLLSNNLESEAKKRKELEQIFQVVYDEKEAMQRDCAGLQHNIRSCEECINRYAIELCNKNQEIEELVNQLAHSHDDANRLKNEVDKLRGENNQLRKDNFKLTTTDAIDLAGSFPTGWEIVDRFKMFRKNLEDVVLGWNTDEEYDIKVAEFCGQMVKCCQDIVKEKLNQALESISLALKVPNVKDNNRVAIFVGEHLLLHYSNMFSHEVMLEMKEVVLAELASVMRMSFQTNTQVDIIDFGLPMLVSELLHLLSMMALVPSFLNPSVSLVPSPNVGEAFEPERHEGFLGSRPTKRDKIVAVVLPAISSNAVIQVKAWVVVGQVPSNEAAPYTLTGEAENVATNEPDQLPSGRPNEYDPLSRTSGYAEPKELMEWVQLAE